ncbi:hypothetical protein ACPL21_22530, partial [Escherichia coli]|uniref:hypothetical protein n=1 Tax=Escherichia coli TaxID=562 RepID=UPI003C759D35
MRSSEWRIVDEPASPGEKAIPVDWTEELDEDENENEDEDVKAAEDIEMSEEAPKTCDTAIEDATTISTNQPVAEI